MKYSDVAKKKENLNALLHTPGVMKDKDLNKAVKKEHQKVEGFLNGVKECLVGKIK